MLQTGLAVAKLEAQVARLVELLSNILSDTKGRVEKKQAQVDSLVLHTLMCLGTERILADGSAAADFTLLHSTHVESALLLPS